MFIPLIFVGAALFVMSPRADTHPMKDLHSDEVDQFVWTTRRAQQTAVFMRRCAGALHHALIDREPEVKKFFRDLGREGYSEERFERVLEAFPAVFGAPYLGDFLAVFHNAYLRHATSKFWRAFPHKTREEKEVLFVKTILSPVLSHVSFACSAFETVAKYSIRFVQRQKRFSPTEIDDPYSYGESINIGEYRDTINKIFRDVNSISIPYHEGEGGYAAHVPRGLGASSGKIYAQPDLGDWIHLLQALPYQGLRSTKSVSQDLKMDCPFTIFVDIYRARNSEDGDTSSERALHGGSKHMHLTGHISSSPFSTQSIYAAVHIMHEDLLKADIGIKYEKKRVEKLMEEAEEEAARASICARCAIM